MKIRWYGASEFLITTDNGVKILTDPFQNNEIFEGPARMPVFGNVIRPTYTGEADIVAMSHADGDHSYIWNVQGVPRLYAGGAPREHKSVKLSSVATCHGNDDTYRNNFIGIEADGIRIWHNGDNGQVLSDQQIKKIGTVDIFMTNWDDDPVEMTFEVLDKVLTQLNPRIVIPMHHCYVDEFMTGRKNFIDHRKDNITEVEFKKDKLPSEMTVMLFKTCNGNPTDFFDPESYKGSVLEALYK
jgi:L-ascorbate metabolism protein UlaG (beta-lactamase superfamily)